MPSGKRKKVPGRRHKHTISPNQHLSISATTPPHHQSQRATAAPSTSSYTWQDLRKDPPTKKRATIATLESKGATTRAEKRAGGYLMAGGVMADMKMGATTHHPLFLPQIDVPKPEGMRPETNRRNLHYVLLKTGRSMLCYISGLALGILPKLPQLCVVMEASHDNGLWGEVKKR